MKFPDRMNARWIDSLTDEQLQAAESELRARFSKQQAAEKKRQGEDYDLMRSGEVAFASWMSWSMVNRAATQRGITVHRR